MEKKSRTVKMNTVKSGEENQENQKLTYEQLEQVANNLNNQCRSLYNELTEARELIKDFNDIGMLLSILGKSEYFDESFTKRCAGKIEEVVTGMLDRADQSKKEAETESKKEN